MKHLLCHTDTQDVWHNVTLDLNNEFIHLTCIPLHKQCKGLNHHLISWPPFYHTKAKLVLVTPTLRIQLLFSVLVHGDLSVSAVAKKYNSDAALSILDTLCTGLSLVECIFLTMPARLKDNCSELAL